MDVEHQISGARPGATRFPLYDGAVRGIRNYWQPVFQSRSLRNGKPKSLTLFNEKIMFLRERGTVYALGDRCPHRGVPLSLGRQEFCGTFSCRYHGWTFDLKSGSLVAALTDGPESAIVGKARVPTYPVAERCGLVWVFHGDGTPPPVEAHIPEEMLAADSVIESRITERNGDWRYAAENGFDESHGKYLHRDSLMMFFSSPPAFVRTQIGPDDWHWITRKTTQAAGFAEYPGLGSWPKKRFWKFMRAIVTVSIALPGVLRVHYGKWIHFEWYVPTQDGNHRYLQFVVKENVTGIGAILFRLRYWLFLRWVFHVQFNDQDNAMVELMQTPPEQLFGPDHSLIAWRALCESELQKT
jgi:phenylpropionate dioxygenase-like ring-hydroxylating dioxygenase large terminal subunit